MNHGITQVFERNQEATLYIGNVDPKIDEEILWELMVQSGPVASVHLPKDKITQQHMGYGFIEFKNEEDADYAIKILNMIKLFGKPIRLNKSSRDKRVNEVGANLFIGNLGEEVDEKTLYDTFAAFGLLLFAKVMRDEKNETKGFGFISYDTFESADNALSNMNGQFLCNRPISVSYAYKKDSRGERHGSAAERLLADHRPVIDVKEDKGGPPPVQGGGKGMPNNRGPVGGGGSGKNEKGNVRPPRFVPQAKHPSMMGGQGKNSMSSGKGATSKASARPPQGMPPQMGRPTMTTPPPGMPAPPNMGGGFRPPQGMPPVGLNSSMSMNRQNIPIGMPLPPPAGMPMPPTGMMGGRPNAPPMGGPPRPMIPTSTGGPPRPPK